MKPTHHDPVALPEAALRVFETAGAALRATAAAGAADFPAAVELLAGCGGKVVTTGVGKSGLAARKIAATLASTGCPAFFLNASDALHGDLGMVGGGDVVLMASNSASTHELVKMLPVLKRVGAGTLGLFGRTNTDLARGLDVVLPVVAESEGCPLSLAPMASIVATLVLGDALAAALMQRRSFTAEDFALRHPAGTLGRRLVLTAADVMHGGEELPAVSPGAGFREIVAELTRSNLGGLCVVHPADSRLAGFISDGDVRRALMRDDPFSLVAEQLMTGNPICATPGQRLGELLDLMETPQRRIYVVPVVDAENRALGLVRMHDILA